MKSVKSAFLFLALTAATHCFAAEITGKVTEMAYLRNREWNHLQFTITSSTGNRDFIAPVGATISSGWGNYVLTEQDVNRMQAQLATALATGMSIRVNYKNTWIRPASPVNGSVDGGNSGPQIAATAINVPEYLIFNP
jgi:hypothetical protein